MVFQFDGRYRSALECKFLEQVKEDLTQFWSICGDNSVLVFPPLSPHYRFLIHQLVGQTSKLHTVSIGQGPERRTVVYFVPERYRNKYTLYIIAAVSFGSLSGSQSGHIINNYQMVKGMLNGKVLSKARLA